MLDHTKLRGIAESALSGSLNDTSAFSLQPENLRLFMEQKVSLMTQYLSITKTMKETFMPETGINLKELLSKRQDCINRIQKTDQSIQKIMNAGAEKLSHVSDELKSSLGGYLHSIKRLLEQIVPIDAEVMMMVKEESQCIRTELLKIRNVRRAAKGYGIKGKHMPMYLDERK